MRLIEILKGFKGRKCKFLSCLEIFKNDGNTYTKCYFLNGCKLLFLKETQET